MGEPSFKDSDNFVGNVGEEIVKLEEYEDEEVEDKETEEVDVKGKGLVSYQTIWTKSKEKQIHECQNKLFGKEQPKREYKLNTELQDEIIRFYKDKNPEFEEAAENYKNLGNHSKKNAAVFLGFLSQNKIFLIKISISGCFY